MRTKSIVVCLPTKPTLSSTSVYAGDLASARFQLGCREPILRREYGRLGSPASISRHSTSTRLPDRSHASTQPNWSFWSNTFFRKKNIGSNEAQNAEQQPLASADHGPVRRLRSALSRRDLFTALKQYQLVLQEARRARKRNELGLDEGSSTGGRRERSGIDPSDLERFAELLLRRCRRRDLEEVVRMFDEASTVFGLDVSSSEYLLKARIRADSRLRTPKDADEWLKSTLPDIANTGVYLALVEEYMRAGKGIEASRIAVQQFSNGSGKIPSNEVESILKHCQELPQHILITIDDFIPQCEALTPSGEVLLARVYHKLSRSSAESDLVEGLRSRHRSGESLPREAWNLLIEHSNGTDEDIEGILQQMETDGCQFGQATIRSLLSSVELDFNTPSSSKSFGLRSASAVNPVVEQVRQWEDRLGFAADTKTWCLVLERLLGSHKSARWRDAEIMELAWNAYGQIVADDLEVTAELANVLIRPLCYTNPPRIIQARQVYGDWLGWYDDSSKDQETALPFVADDTIKSMYTSLFRALCLKQSDVAPGKMAIQLLEDMRDRHFTLPLGTAINEISSLMAVMPDHNDAFRIYSYTRALDPSLFDETAYHRIITAFCKTSLPKSRFAHPQLLLEFIRDMKSSRINPSPRIFTSIIDHYTKYTRSRIRVNQETPEDSQKAIQAIQRVHAYIKLDAFLDVDIPLLNALMDAYNQAGAWQQCWEVWEELMTRYRFDPHPTDYQPSLNIVLDACGYSGDVKRGRAIWSWANAIGMNINRSNWAAYIEFLSRNKRAIEATEELVRLRDLPGKSFEVDAKLLSIPLKLSRQHNERQSRIKVLIQQEFPELWPSLSHIIRSDSQPTDATSS